MEVDESDERLNARDRDAHEMDYENFLQEVDADKEFRTNINLYKKTHTRRSDDAMRVDNANESEEEDDEEVDLNELLDELTVSDELTRSAAILTESEAANQPAIIVEGLVEEFDSTKYDGKNYKF